MYKVHSRYCKYSRELPQTPWIINGVRKCESSIEEVIGEQVRVFLGATEVAFGILLHFLAVLLQVRFLASGREDVDVRMLGSGRPFAFEAVNPKKTKLTEVEAKKLEALINTGQNGVSGVHSGDELFLHKVCNRQPAGSCELFEDGDQDRHQPPEGGRGGEEEEVHSALCD